MSFRRNHHSLRHINYLQIARIIGWLLIIEAAFMTVPLATSLLTDKKDLGAFLLSIGITLTAGLSATILVRPRRTEMAKREGFLLTALVWIVFSAFGMLPFIFSDTEPLGITDGFFEAMSGFTTTGATVLTSVSGSSHAATMWRCLTQWLGGMGIILFTLAVIPMLNSSGGMQMFNAEVTGITHDKIRPRISQTATRLWGVYIILSVLLFILLIIGPMTPFEALCHTFTSISTGGYSTQDASIGHWDSHYTEIILTVFMFLGGVNFALIYKAVTGFPKAMWRNDVLRAYIWTIVVCYLLFTITIIVRGQYTGIASVTIDPIFQIVSTITSTGYTARNFEAWGPFVLALTFMLMFIGGCAGSTSGGAKMDRMLFLTKNLRNELYLGLHPNDVMRVRINDRIIPPHIVSKVIAFLCLFVIITAFGGITLTACGLPLVDSFFSAFSCLSNIGLGAGVTGYGGGYDLVPALGKWVLSFLMLVGRLELFTVLILFTPGFWSK
ncbi:MAG: TrkH family potassium uptake protein [Pseudoflavonifractor sp.]|nr:TrkH family potassium uptake protein [Alloprevotella sp.]MCM1117351.1 TrkH family potassium uptake protein [Pseudoflavonifractor sp.]